MPQAAGAPISGSRQAQTQVADLFFPISGIDVSVALEWQNPDTTPDGVNVRTFEPSTMRARGGQRPGLAQFVPQQLPLSFNPSGTHLIQHLQLVVDPQAAALGASFDDIAGDFPLFWLEDPGFQLADGSFNDVYAQGSGYHTSKTTKRKVHQLIIIPNNQTKQEGDTFVFNGTEFSTVGLAAGDTVFHVTLESLGQAPEALVGSYPIRGSNAVITLGVGHSPYHVNYKSGTMTVGGAALVQSGFCSQGNLSVSPVAVQTVTMTQDVTAGNLIVLHFFTIATGIGSTTLPIISGVVDGHGNAFTKAGGSASSASVLDSGLHEDFDVAIWYLITPVSGALDLTITFAPTSTAATLYGTIEEFSGIDAASPLRSTSFGNTALTVPSGTTTLTAGALAANEFDLIVVNFGSATWDGPVTFTPTAPLIADNEFLPAVAYLLASPSGGLTPEGTLTLTDTNLTSASRGCVAASFKVIP